MSQKVRLMGELEPQGMSGVALDAKYIIDRENNGLNQSNINSIVETLAGASNFVTIPATSSDTSIGAVFTRVSITPATDTLYRIGNWKHDGSPQYNVNYYSVYGTNSASIDGLVPVALSENGIDDNPTPGSTNLVSSGGIYEFTHSLTTEAVNVDTLPEPSEDTIHKIYCTPVSNSTPLNTKNEFITIYDEIVPDYTNVDGLLTLANVPTDEDGAQIGDGTFIVNVTSTNKAYYVTIVRHPSEYGYIVTSVICETGKYAKLQTNELYISNGTAWVVQPSDRIYKWESLSPDMSNYYTKAEIDAMIAELQR